ncbi:HAMP domain-containing histidine kinase [Synechococcus sp. Cruz-9H2]|uniref:sensor histidine kinase n=1 Tax=unclassified Synechococcus TaxID=2626047 RepID=UPI0020CB9213|nr:MULTISPECIES: HAMP domain-containing sensor histidine kinase [unclassified Synechococcus]MCP9820366.1 HAMP domain-containing histidine kinase [Synechococcus sp. Cruz-9H2]MCP9844674.1 HAMP domain-containing histidine kinase [Synechococcus sp. Edmonson 11F2]MCP9856796.1 HAMP domain-containing histidine kinase [Synechococcus sp. Cruz-9C9]MCP9863994.1 HAMP domain-containing histidine kinase [Synechococcus sp. Cruz-7E5]MCP9871189.1 HAMP domain-containing histidine kinase [Synechococcus sp. Cruz-
MALPLPRSNRPSSIRQQLLTTSLMAVLAGYGVLLLANQALSWQARLQAHRQAVDRVMQPLTAAGSRLDAAGLQALLNRMITPGLTLSLERPPVSTESQPVFRRRDGTATLTSTRALDLDGSVAVLRIVQDVSAAAERERFTQSLLFVAAGVSSLLTSALLRPVLRRGLSPLDQLSRRLAAMSSESLELERLDPEEQPRELQPIVVSFNALLGRLAGSWERQRIFVDGVAHELRTPITLISGQAQSLQRQADASASIGPAVRQPLRLIASEALRMGRLVSDLLDIARDDAGRLKLRSGRVDLDDALLVAFERLQPLAAGRLKLQAPTEEQAPVAAGDADRLQQCLTNLVENALKYTPEATPIELFSSRHGDQLIAHVRDHGPGISLAEKERIFERFARGTLQSSVSGSGIGLSMVRLLMERMGGGVRVADTPGGGADFQLLLRLADQPGLP